MPWCLCGETLQSESSPSQCDNYHCLEAALTNEHGNRLALEIYQLLLARSANANARAAIDAEGFGGHPPLFNAVVCGPWHDPAMTRRLLLHGASTDVRVSLRKFLDWCETPRMHEARNVTAARRPSRCSTKFTAKRNDFKHLSLNG